MISECSIQTDRPELSDDEKQRYLRQTLIFGCEGQRLLKNSHVFIAGCGGLGSPVALYLAAAGVGTLTIVDQDIVTLSNLNRQILHWTSDIGKEKTKSAEKKVRFLNPEIIVSGIQGRITEETIPVFAQGADLIIDAVDSVEIRHIINRYAIKAGIPFIHGAVQGLSGQLMVILPGKTPCLRCLVGHPPKPGVIPVLGTTAGIIGTMQADMAIKLITGTGSVPTGRLILWDGISATLEHLIVRKNDQCPVCGHYP